MGQFWRAPKPKYRPFASLPTSLAVNPPFLYSPALLTSGWSTSDVEWDKSRSGHTLLGTAGSGRSSTPVLAPKRDCPKRRWRFQANLSSPFRISDFAGVSEPPNTLCFTWGAKSFLPGFAFPCGLRQRSRCACANPLYFPLHSQQLAARCLSAGADSESRGECDGAGSGGVLRHFSPESAGETRGG